MRERESLQAGAVSLNPQVSQSQCLSNEMIGSTLKPSFHNLQNSPLLLYFGLFLTFGSCDDGIASDFSASMTQINNLSKSMEQRYRAVGMLDDFSNIVGNMIQSLKEVEAKGQNMVSKINKQKERLDLITREVEYKEVQMRNFEEKKIAMDSLVQKAKLDMESMEARKAKLEAEVTRLEVKRGKMSREVKSLGEVVDSKREDKEQALARMEEELGSVRSQIDNAKVELG